MEDSKNLLRADDWEQLRTTETDQTLGKPVPPMQKPYPKDATLLDLVSPEDFKIGEMPLIQAIKQRQSRRRYNESPLSLEQLSFLLWATQGVKRHDERHKITLRTVPSGGARHPFETYLIVNRVDGLEHGLYRYLALEHKLLYLAVNPPDIAKKLTEANLGQGFVGKAAVVFAWTAIPYRTEWQYAMVAPKIIAQDSGHLCQNLYLAAEAIQAGTCAVGAYVQSKMDALIGVDGDEEFTIYVAPVGMVD